MRAPALLAAVLGALAAAAGTPAAGPRFSAHVDNPWFPLRPGTVYRYRGVKDGRPSREVMTVTHRVAAVGGAPCVAVDDRLWVDGHLEERTTDWYTQDDRGNVWYFGERTAELDRAGRVKSTEGSWRAGHDGAQPGIFMFAHPRVGRSARQEYSNGRAEDHFAVLALQTSVMVPWLRSSGALLTKEWTPLEPGILDHKYYVRGVGTVLEQTVKGGNERNELISFSR